MIQSRSRRNTVNVDTFSLVEAKYVFLDVVSFSNRSVEAQAAVVEALNGIVSVSLQKLRLDLHNAKMVICIPTGDGMCVVLMREGSRAGREVDIHVRLACEILNRLSHYNQSIREPEEAFKVRIGINENVDISVIDINGRRNVAGAGINDAARVMDLGGGNQILVCQNVYERLRVRRKYQTSFRPFAVAVKHRRQMAVYQYAPQDREGGAILDTTEPPSIMQRKQSRRDSDLIPSEGLVYEAMRSLIAGAQKNIVIVTAKRDWIYPLIPSIIFARVRGVRLFVIHYPDSATDQNRGELRLLDQLGCLVTEKDPKLAAPFEGTFTEFDEEYQARGLVRANKAEVAGFHARKLYARGDLPILKTLQTVLRLDTSESAHYAPSIEAASVRQAIEWMKQVPLYSSCEISVRTVDLRTVRPVAPDLRLFKIKQADTIRQLLHRCKVLPYGPAIVTLKNGNKSPILPPVLEEHDGVLCIAEGHNRLYSSLRYEQRVKALVVSGLSKALQRPTSLWQDVRVDDDRVSSGLSPEARAYARNIESSVHQNLFGDNATGELPKSIHRQKRTWARQPSKGR